LPTWGIVRPLRFRYVSDDLRRRSVSAIGDAIHSILADSEGLTARRLVRALSPLGHKVDKAQVNSILYSSPAFRRDDSTPPRWFLSAGLSLPNDRPAPHRLLTIAVRNWKAFADATALLAGVTLVYGENSSGKSSLFQAMLLLKQSWGHGEVQFEGPLGSFGWFEHVVHQHDMDRDIGFTAHWGADDPDEYWAVRLDLPHGPADDGYEPQHPIGRITCFGPERAVAGKPFGEAGEWLLIPIEDEIDAAPDADFVESLRDQVVFVAADERGFPDVSQVERAQAVPGSRPDRSVEQTVGLVREALDGARAMLDSIEHIGPSRPLPERDISLDWAKANAKYLARLFAEPDLVLDVNEWLVRFDVPYEVEIAWYGDNDGDQQFSLDLRRRGGAGEKVQLRDVGFGVSQLLPIIVQLLGSREKTILIEEPEAHVHPRLQSVIGDLMVTSSQDYGNVLVVETHSEPILLRLQRRIAEGRVDHEDVAVMHVIRRGEASEIELVPIQENGQLDYQWPGGFFDDRMDDLVAILDPRPDE
jgi:energy-coupling factor transporter ATP-binding protein EcfA2